MNQLRAQANSVPPRVHAALVSQRSELIDAFKDFAFLAVTSVVNVTDELRRAELLFQLAVQALGPAVQRQLPPGWSCAAGGSFVHGSQGRYLVDPDVGKPCEIGDLLVAVEFQLGQESARSAVLIQAKRPGSPASAPWTKDGAHQRDFYRVQPPFTWQTAAVAYTRPSDKRTLASKLDCPCSTTNWDIRHGPDCHWSRWPDEKNAIYGQAIFATLDDHPTAVPPFEGKTPRLLGEVFADLMLFAAGGEVATLTETYQPKTLGWSAVVWDILRRSATRDHASKFGNRRPDRTPVRFQGEEDLPEESSVVAATTMTTVRSPSPVCLCEDPTSPNRKGTRRRRTEIG
jgi:hypothetical protein